jgi:hypothetical protein
MNQNSTTINLRAFTDDDRPFGNEKGKETFRKLSDYIDAHPQYTVIGVSLADIATTDASFSRESVVAIAKQYRGQRSVFLEGTSSRDVIDNWRYAAIAKEQPLVVWKDDGYEVLGPEASTSNKLLIDFVYAHESVTAVQVAEQFDLSTPNASTRLKKLADQGYFMRSPIVAESGGIEYIYHAVKNSG